MDEFWNGKQSTESKPISVKYASQAGPRLDVSTFVKGLLGEGALSVIYGAPKAGKTFFAIDLALRVACGMDWHERRVKQGVVLYLALEGGPGIERRICAWKDRHDAMEQQICFAWAEAPIDLRSSHGSSEAIVQAARQAAVAFRQPARLIVIDTVARALAGGSDCDPEHMGALIKAADQIRSETGAHVMLIHHAGKDADRGARGWSGLLGAIDTQIEVTAADGLHLARVTDQRDLETGEIFPFRLERVDLGDDADGDPVTTCVAIEAGGREETKPTTQSRIGKMTITAQEVCSALSEALAAAGERNRPGAMIAPSVSEYLWRSTFYGRSCPGDAPEKKRQAFMRGVKALMHPKQGRPIIAMNSGRVWFVDHENQPE